MYKYTNEERKFTTMFYNLMDCEEHLYAHLPTKAIIPVPKAKQNKL